MPPTTSPRSTPPPLGLVPVDGWRQRAACNGHPSLPATCWDDSLAEHVRETREQRAARHGRAKAVCAGCPVKVPCLADVDLDFDEGVRGGEDLRELKEVRRRAKKWSA